MGKQLSEHFNASEFACKCGCGYKDNGAGIDPKLVQVLEKIRERLGKPIIINSGLRCPTHNESVGGVYNSRHVIGDACDIGTIDGVSNQKLFDTAVACGADGVSMYSWGVHIDTRGYDARW